mmetsp:Transcript_8318/g.12810  ORF Transcript_8318/g.12810 Transcript_8318/m.12810 type:complete len:271 (+) Transcript_8318:58-870(+)
MQTFKWSAAAYLFAFANAFINGASTIAPDDSSAIQRGRGIINDDLSNEELYRSFRDTIQDYQDKAFSKLSKWKTLRQTRDGIEISMLDSEGNSPPYIRFKAEIPTTAEKVYDFTGFSNWEQFMPIINPFYKSMKVVEEWSVGKAKMFLARKLSKRILCYGKRDFSLLSVVDTSSRDDGMLVSGTLSVVSPDHIPRQSGFTRAYQDMVCFYKPLGRDQMELTIILKTDLNDSVEDEGTGGYFPMGIVVKTLGYTGPEAMRSLRKVLKTSLP